MAGFAGAQSNITVRVLPVLSGSTDNSQDIWNNVAYDVNNSGDIVGANSVAGYAQPVIWPAGGSPVDLGVPPGITSGFARSITDNGYIVGSSAYVTDGSYGTAIMFRPGPPVALPGLSGGTANSGR